MYNRSSGNPSMTRPVGDFSSTDLANLFYPPQIKDNPPTHPTSSSDDNSLSGGAIAGIVIGCLAAAAVVGFGIWWALRKPARRDYPMEIGGDSVGEMDGGHIQEAGGTPVEEKDGSPILEKEAPFPQEKDGTAVLMREKSAAVTAEALGPRPPSVAELP